MLFLSSNASAQTVQLTPLTRTIFCSGDTLVLRYTTSGSFKPDNLFITQLSGVNDSFATFTNMGTDTGHLGYFKIALKTTGSPYLFRVIATDPNLFSNWVGSDIVVSPYPSPSPVSRRVPRAGPLITGSPIVGLIGDTIKVIDGTNEPAGSTYAWKFGQDAPMPSSASRFELFTYPSAGVKFDTLTVTDSAGCATTKTTFYEIASCRPRIPAGVHIVRGSESGGYANVWIKAFNRLCCLKSFWSCEVFDKLV